jgi:CRISPR-associated exonuclease Cas4
MSEPRFVVTDLKQYAYCPRIVYYHACLPHVRPTTYKMQAGVEAHADERAREQRRSLRAYGLPEGERHFAVQLASEALDLRGRVDLVILTADEAIPVEYKDSTRRVGHHLKLQLTAYGLMIEDKWNTPVHRGFLYSIPNRRASEVRLGGRLRAEVQKAVAEMQRIADGERMPDPPKRKAQCVTCEFRRFCNDVL